MELKSEDRSKQLDMIIDNEKMLVTIYTLKIQKIKDIFPDFNSNDYIIISSPAKVAKPIGSILFSFINAKFNTLDGFKSFIDVWGLSGMLKIAYDNKDLDIEYGKYNIGEINELILKFYENTNLALVEAQQAFKKVVDFCVNTDNVPCLQDLSAIKRYFVGITNNLIPDLFIYTSPFSVFSFPIKADGEIPRFKIRETHELDDLCTTIKSIDLIVGNRYLSQSIITLAYIEFFNLLNNLSVNKCAHCKEYFVPKSKINEVYCADCRNIGYINKVKSDKLLKAYNTAYKTKHAEKRRRTKGKSETTVKKYDDALKKWREESKHKLKLAQDGKISEETLIEFFKSKLEV